MQTNVKERIYMTAILCIFADVLNRPLFIFKGHFEEEIITKLN